MPFAAKPRCRKSFVDKLAIRHNVWRQRCNNTITTKRIDRALANLLPASIFVEQASARNRLLDPTFFWALVCLAGLTLAGMLLKESQEASSSGVLVSNCRRKFNMNHATAFIAKFCKKNSKYRYIKSSATSAFKPQKD